MNPFAGSRLYGKIGNYLNRPLFRFFPVAPGFALITTIGRRSGLPRRQPVRAVRLDGRLVIASIHGDRSDWYRNLVRNPRVLVKLGSRTFSGNARCLLDEAEREETARAYAEALTFYDWLDYAALYWDVPTRAKIHRAHEAWAQQGLVIIDLDPET